MKIFPARPLPGRMSKKEGGSGNPFDFTPQRKSNRPNEFNQFRQSHYSIWQHGQLLISVKLCTMKKSRRITRTKEKKQEALAQEDNHRPRADKTGEPQQKNNDTWNGSTDDNEEFSDSGKGKKSYHRHTSHQIQQLEAFFKECPHPDENQRRQLSRELGLEAKQIKFWFQNKRTQTKAQNERADNNALRAENERIHCENLAFGEALKNVICPSCGDHPPLGEEERQLNIQKLRMENLRLKEQHERLSNLITSMTGKPISLLLDSIGYSSHSPADNFFAQGSGSPFLDPDTVFRNLQNPTSPYGSNAIVEIDKSVLVETASRALDELLELLRVNEPVWAKSQTDGKYVLHHERYTKMFPKSSHLKGTSAQTESSKDSTVVPVNALDLVEMFLDMSKWADLFPTIVTKARILETIDTGSIGSLKLIYEEMHILSPLVVPREFLFLRYCQQVDQSTWVIVDASCDCFREIQDTSLTRSWRRPSGSMIQSLPNGKSKVTWIEHVEVNDKSQNHRLYRDLIDGAQAYGASRWITTLQRICERSMYSAMSSTTSHELEGVINVPEGRRNMMKLSNRMVKNLCAILSMPERLDFPHFSESTNSGVRITIRKNNEPCQPHGMIIAAATSQWLPLPFEALFSFLRDENKRPQWDMMSNGCPVNEIAHISTGTHPGNHVSLLQPFMSNQSSMLLLQENSIDQLGAHVIFAPIDLPAIMATLSGEDMMKVPVLPSGFLISGDGRSNGGTGISGASTSTSTVSRQVGSLLTFAFQIVVPSDSAPRQIIMDSVTTLNTLITSMIQRIKMALDCCDLD